MGGEWLRELGVADFHALQRCCEASTYGGRWLRGCISAGAFSEAKRSLIIQQLKNWFSKGSVHDLKI